MRASVGTLAMALVLACLAPVATAQPAPGPGPDRQALRDFRAEALAYSVGLQAYLYGYPAVDYERVMREQTTKGMDPHAVFAPLNQFYYQTGLAEPGGLFAGRAPNNVTIYFSAWLDLRAGPVTVEVPDMGDRYYALTYADFYSEVQHTGRRTTGNAAQTVQIVGPDWQGEAPAGTRLIRLRTWQGYLLGRVYVAGPDDLAAAKSLASRIRLTAPKPVAPLDLPLAGQMSGLDYFGYLNRFLRENPRLPGEEVLMAQFDQVGLGPKVKFDPNHLSAGARRGLERAVADGHRILADAPLSAEPHPGWGPTRQMMGAYGTNYLVRAITEYNGFLGNLPEESVYPSALSDTKGNPLDGSRRYRLVFASGAIPPNDAFWSLSAYDSKTVDLMPNPIRRYSIGDRTPGLRRRADGTIEIRIQKEAPTEADVNWLPVGVGPFFLTMRIYQPRPEALSGAYKLPPIEALP